MGKRGTDKRQRVSRGAADHRITSYNVCYTKLLRVLNEIAKFINADNDLQELFEIKDYKNEITGKLTNTVIRALGRDTKSIDGFRPYLGIVDEYHAHKDNQMYKLLKGGTRKLKQSLISVITTAGFNLNAPCYELYKYFV